MIFCIGRRETSKRLTLWVGRQKSHETITAEEEEFLPRMKHELRQLARIDSGF
jgi:hypothetical protein